MDPRPQRQDDYAIGQLARAWTTSESHPDQKVRDQARVKIEQWNLAIKGMLDGSISVGSRAPVASTPVWGTLEVVKGGFATGALKAGGPLQGHELALLERLGIALGEDGRRQVNTYFLSEEGIATLQSQLQSGCYEIDVPEEGALPAAIWLLTNGKADEARALIEQIAPWFGQLRFFPIPAFRPRQLGARVCLEDVQGVIDNLSEIVPKRALLAQAHAIGVRIPLYDRLVSLFLDTVEGEPPRIAPDASGAWTDPVSRKFLTTGGWPCKHYPPDWHGRAKTLIDEIDATPALGNEGDSFAQLCTHLRNCHRAPHALTGREVGRIRLLLARYVSKRGEPGSASCLALRQQQAAQAKTIDYHALAKLVTARLGDYPGDEGLDDAEPVLCPVTPGEAQQWRVASGTAMPRSIRRKVGRSRIDTVQGLVNSGWIASAEMLATVLPLMTASITAAGIADRALQQLYGAIYQAFRRRRSLLLVNLQKQVQLEELPWAAVLDTMREKNAAPAVMARKALEETVLLALTSFPQTVIPNKLLQELRALAKAADLKLPLVEELATDIFAGAFSAKFTEAAQCAAAMVDHTIYARYYGIDVQRSLQLPQATLGGIVNTILKTLRPAVADASFLKLCEERAGVKRVGYSTIVNGMLIEQQQILTTQNLAVLIGGLGLRAEVEAVAGKLAQQCFVWICRDLQLKRPDRHAQLIARKNSAYAWRQMMFFLALQPGGAASEFLAWASEHLGKQAPEFAARFAPVLAGLRQAAAGEAVDRPFLAYSQGNDWL